MGGNEAEFGVGFPAGVDLCAIGPCQITNRSAAQLPDADGDGIPDDADNCPFDENPGQEDVDLDLLGDPCDPFPQRRDNDLAQCEEDVATCLANPAIPDADADGEPDVVDICPGSGSGPVDLGGCSLDQFCARFSVTDLSGRRACRRADWLRDEGALFLARPRDCTVVTAGTPFDRSDDRCLPR